MARSIISPLELLWNVTTKTTVNTEVLFNSNGTHKWQVRGEWVYVAGARVLRGARCWESRETRGARATETIPFPSRELLAPPNTAHPMLLLRLPRKLGGGESEHPRTFSKRGTLHTKFTKFIDNSTWGLYREIIFGGAYYCREFCVSKWVGLENKDSLKHQDNNLKPLI